MPDNSSSIQALDAPASVPTEPFDLKSRHEQFHLRSAPALPATPRTLTEWLRFGWSRLLFPAPRDEAGGIVWWKLAMLVLLPGLLLYPCMTHYLFEPDEGRYAQIPREMLERGDWIVPVLQGEPYLDKPPLFYWCVMVSYQLFGYHAWAARLIPALAMHLSVLACYLIGRKLVGERNAWAGSWLLILTPGFFGVGRLLLLDGLLTWWVTVSLLMGFWAQQVQTQQGHTEAGQRPHGLRWLVAALSCGLGVLTKGPVALILVLPPLVLQRWLTGQRPIPFRNWLTFLSVVLAVSLPWYAAACHRLPDFAGHFFWEHNVIRFVDAFDHPRPVWFYGPVLLASFFPWVFLGYHYLRFLTAPENADRRSAPLGFFLLAGGWCVFFFSLSGCKLPTYILPAFPFLALALGCFIGQAGWTRWHIATAAAALFIMVAAHFAVVPYYAHKRTPINAEVERLCADPATPVYGFPRNVDSVAFYMGRADVASFRSKNVVDLVRQLENHPRTVILFGHRSSPDLLRAHLPPHLQLVHEAPMGLCKIGVVELTQ